MTISIRTVMCCLFILCLQTAKSQSKDEVVSVDRLNRLKERTVIFVLPKTEYRYIDDYTSMLSKVWTLTPLKVVKFKDLHSYNKDVDKYFYFTIGGLEHTVFNGSSSYYTNTHYYLKLSTAFVESGKLRSGTEGLCRIELYPDMATVFISPGKYLNPTFYLESSFRNFTLPYMMVYLKFVQQNILNGNNPSVYHSYEDKELLSKIKSDTLYVPDSLIYSRNKLTGKERQEDEDLFSDYPGKYKFVSTTELINIIKTRDESKPVFLFEYVLSSTDKYVGVLDVRSGKVIYRKYTPMSYNLKAKDIRKILD
jgi:hypothetical protein